MKNKKFIVLECVDIFGRSIYSKGGENTYRYYCVANFSSFF